MKRHYIEVHADDDRRLRKVLIDGEPVDNVMEVNARITGNEMPRLEVTYWGGFLITGQGTAERILRRVDSSGETTDVSVSQIMEAINRYLVTREQADRAKIVGLLAGNDPLID